jgi:hypothetical protein
MTDPSLIMMADWKRIRDEPMLFGCDPETAYNLGGNLTRRFLRTIPERTDYIIDSRSHMLKPGWYPGIPGWHLDDVPRDGNGKPMLEQSRTSHYTIVVDAYDQPTGSLTEFILPEELPPLPADHDPALFNSLWHCHSSMIEAIDPPTYSVQSGIPFRFGPQDYHRATKATGSGWRWFIRASYYCPRPAINELRTQVQVYLSPLETGW